MRTCLHDAAARRGVHRGLTPVVAFDGEVLRWAGFGASLSSSRESRCGMPVLALSQEGQDRVHAAVVGRRGRKIELAEDAAHMGLDGLLTEEERLADATVGAPLGHK